MKKYDLLIVFLFYICFFVTGNDSLGSNKAKEDFQTLAYDELGKRTFLAMKAGENKRAESLLNEMLRRQMKMKNPENAELGSIYFYLGQVTHNDDFFIKSESFLNKALTQDKNLTESDKNKIFNCYYILGRMALSQNKNALAIKRLENTKKLFTFQTKKKQEHVNTCFYLAIGYYREKNWQKAIENINKSIDLCKKINGPASVSTASCQAILAKILYGSGKRQEAISLIKNVHAVFLEQRGKENSTTKKLAVLLKKWEASS